MIKHICKQCNKEFLTKRSISKYCSKKCFWESEKGIRKSVKTEFKKGQGFWTGKKRPTMSGINHPNYVEKITRKCLSCGKIIKIIPSKANKANKGKFCSKKCYYNNKKGCVGWNNKGGKSKNEDGYILIWNPAHPYSQKKGYVLEHRFVMEKHIGRYLLPEEVVHHIDEDKTNNSINNLILFNNRNEHFLYHKNNKK